MCGRFTQKSERRIITEEFYITEFLDPVLTSYNVAPGSDAGVILGPGSSPRYARYRWGLVPSWAKDPGIGNRMINARSETVREKPSYRQAFRKRRCIVPVDGFYEWRKDGGLKVPYFIRQPSGRPFSLAGLWETWEDPDAHPLRTFTILTTNANARLRDIHDRMPVVIPPDGRALWLDGGEGAHGEGGDEEALLALLAPSPDPLLEYYEVSRIVNSPRNDSPACIEPVRR